MKKKLLSVLLAAALSMTVTGCGRDKTNDNNNNAAKETETEIQNSGAQGAELTCQLTVWGPAEDQAEAKGNWLPKMCEAFAKEHPTWNIDFRYGVCAEGEAKTNVTQDVEGAADVYLFANDNIADLISNKALSRIGGSALEKIQAENTEEVVDSVTVDGAVYGFPFATNTWYMYYDKNVFSEEDVKSLDTMLSKGKVAFPLTDSWYIAAFYVANGGTMFGDTQTDEAAGIDFGGDKGAQVTDYLIDLAANPNFVNDENGDVGIAGLRDGSVNAIFSGSWKAADVKDALDDRMGVAVLPVASINGQDCQLRAFAGPKAVGVNPNCKNQKVAVALAEFLSSEEAQLAHYQARGVVPCHAGLLEGDEMQADPLVSVQNTTFYNMSIRQPFVAVMGNYWDAAKSMGQAIVNGEVTHENAAAKTEAMNQAMNTSVAEGAR